MPTCSQAKIITNLESDINKRFFRLVSELPGGNIVDISPTSESNQQQQPRASYDTNVETIELTKIDLNRRRISKHDCIGNKPPQPTIIAAKQQQQQPIVVYTSSSTKASRRISIDEIIPPAQLQQSSNHRGSDVVANNFQLLRLHKVPIVFGDFNYAQRKDSVPLNFLYNSTARATNRNSLTNNQLKIGTLRSELNLSVARNPMMMMWGSDGEECEVESSSRASTDGDKSSISLPDNQQNSGSNNVRRGSLVTRKSFDYCNCLPIR